MRKQAHEISRADIDELIDEVLRNQPDPVAHQFGAAGVECFHNQTPEPGVVGWILEKHGLPEQAHRWVCPDLRQLRLRQHAVVGVTQGPVPKHRLHVVVACDDEEVCIGQVQDWRVLPQRLVGRVGVGDDLRRENRLD